MTDIIYICDVNGQKSGSAFNWDQQKLALALIC
jgi:hypothetical protein